MPKVTLEYNLPEENDEYALAMNGQRLHSAATDFENKIRTMIKYESEKYTAKQLDLLNELRTEFYELFGELL